MEHNRWGASQRTETEILALQIREINQRLVELDRSSEQEGQYAHGSLGDKYGTLGSRYKGLNTD